MPELPGLKVVPVPGSRVDRVPRVAGWQTTTRIALALRERGADHGDQRDGGDKRKLH
jgi:hypothetical protein